MGSATQHRDREHRQQPTLFGGPEPIDYGKRTRDEVFAAISGSLTEAEQLWFSRIIACGERGTTVDRLSEMYGRSPNEFSGRITALKKKGVVIATREQRKTRTGSPASVIVAARFIEEKQQPRLPGSAPNQPQERKTMPDVMPDQSTCTKTPKDQHGEFIQSGCDYTLERRGDKPVRVTVFEDPATSDLWFKKIGGDREASQRVDQIDPRATWSLIDDQCG